MSTQLKIIQVKEAMNRVLGNFTTYGSVTIPITFILDNKEPNGEFNVFLVESKKEAEDIATSIINNKNIKDNVEDYSKPLYLTVIPNVPL